MEDEADPRWVPHSKMLIVSRVWFQVLEPVAEVYNFTKIFIILSKPPYRLKLFLIVVIQVLEILWLLVKEGSLLQIMWVVSVSYIAFRTP